MPAILSSLSRHARAWAAAPDRKPLPRQAAEILRLWRAQGRPPFHYITNHLYRLNAPERPESFLSWRLLEAHHKAVNRPEARGLANDKARLGRHLEAHGLPALRELLRVSADGRAFDPEGRALSPAEAEARLAAHGGPLFAKPPAGSLGRGAFALPAGAGLAALTAARADLLVQPRLVQHPALDALKPGLLNTLRVDSFLDGGRAVCGMAVLKLGMGATVTDNSAGGSILVAVDPRTGRLGRWGRRKHGRRPGVMEAHPDTGARFEGVEVPFWAETRALVLRAAETLPELPSLGWDVAVTAEGPVIVEANWNWDATLYQLGGIGLAETPVGRAALAWAGRPTPPSA